MLYFKQQLSQELQDQVVQHMEENVLEHLYSKQGGVAHGRPEIWIPWRAPLYKSQGWADALHDAKLWSWIERTGTKIGFTPEVGLITHGEGIGKHRDASYAGKIGLGINFGVATFHIAPQYELGQWKRDAVQGEWQTYELTGGEVFIFNPKNEHYVTDVDPNRWSVNAWDVQPVERGRFNRIKEAHPLEGGQS